MIRRLFQNCLLLPFLIEENISQIGTSIDFKKILFYKQIRIKRKVLKELLLFNGEKKSLDHYVFENAKNYRLKKRNLLEEHEIILASFDFIRTRSKTISHPEFLLKLLIENTKGFSKINFYLGEGREKYILGGLEFKDILTQKPLVERVYFFSKGDVIIPIVKYQYLQNNAYVIKEKIVPFYLDKETLNERDCSESRKRF